MTVQCSICTAPVRWCQRSCKLPCGHKFHKDCIEPWTKTHNSCPNCREPVVPPSPDSKLKCKLTFDGSAISHKIVTVIRRRGGNIAQVTIFFKDKFKSKYNYHRDKGAEFRLHHNGLEMLIIDHNWLPQCGMTQLVNIKFDRAWL